MHRPLTEPVSAESPLNALATSSASTSAQHDVVCELRRLAVRWARIQSDFPELSDDPYLWQQAECVMGGAPTHFVLLTLAADPVPNEDR